MCTAPYRLGLTATPPALESEARTRIDQRVGPVVCEVGLDDLLGIYLANLDIIRLNVELSATERAIYWPAVREFTSHRQRFFRDRPGAEWRHFIGMLLRSEEGRRIMDDHLHALRIASFPNAKRERTLELLALHRHEKVLVFTANVEGAYELSRLALAPAITAETARTERDEMIDAFRVGRIRTIIAARVLNEGIDVPDARVAIVVGAAQGAREMVQRVGRVLRPAPDKRALVY
jgi:superfamily II DNA or RNA helicase